MALIRVSIDRCREAEARKFEEKAAALEKAAARYSIGMHAD